MFAEYNQQGATFHGSFISVRRPTCFRQFFRPSSWAQNCTYSVGYWSDKYLTLYVQFWAPDDGRKNRMKHVGHLTEINKSCWPYPANILAMHGPMNVKFIVLRDLISAGVWLQIWYRRRPTQDSVQLWCTKLQEVDELTTVYYIPLITKSCNSTDTRNRN
jgi:hypothetical protein